MKNVTEAVVLHTQHSSMMKVEEGQLCRYSHVLRV